VETANSVNSIGNSKDYLMSDLAQLSNVAAYETHTDWEPSNLSGEI